MFKKKTAGFFIILALAVAAAIPIRTYLIIYYIDPVTEFYDGSTMLVPILNVLLTAATLIMLVSYLFASLHEVKFVKKASLLTAVLCSLISASLCLEAGHQFYLLILGSGDGGNFFTSAAAFVAAIFFFLYAGSALKEKNARFPAAALFPVVWAVIHLIVSFMHYTTVINISEYLYDMLKMVFMMIFLYYHSRYAGGVSNKRELSGMVAFGLPAVLFSLVSVLPRFFAYFAGSKTSFNLFDDLSYLFLAIYITVTLIQLLLMHGYVDSVGKPEETVVHDPESAQE